MDNQQAITGAVLRVNEFDSRAERAQLAFALGPDAFREYLKLETDLVKERLEKANAAAATT